MLECVCLGVGKGISYCYEGIPSSGFLIRDAHKNILLVDCGNGITLQALKHKNQQQILLVDNIFISHNHTDHAGEAPVIIQTECLKCNAQNKCKLNIFAQEQVLERVKNFRCAEMYSNTSYNTHIVPFLNWNAMKLNQLYSLTDTISIQLVASKHSELCYGFILYYDSIPLLSFSGDSAFDDETYAKLWSAKCILLDARPFVPTHNENAMLKCQFEEHASFEQVIEYCAKRQLFDKQVYLYHYGRQSEIEKLNKLLESHPFEKELKQCIHCVVPQQSIPLPFA